MEREEILSYIESFGGVAYDCPFEGDFDSVVLRHVSTRRWFGLYFAVPKRYFGEEGEGSEFCLNLKCPAAPRRRPARNVRRRAARLAHEQGALDHRAPARRHPARRDRKAAAPQLRHHRPHPARAARRGQAARKKISRRGRCGQRMAVNLGGRLTAPLFYGTIGETLPKKEIFV